MGNDYEDHPTPGRGDHRGRHVEAVTTPAVCDSRDCDGHQARMRAYGEAARAKMIAAGQWSGKHEFLFQLEQAGCVDALLDYLSGRRQLPKGVKGNGRPPGGGRKKGRGKKRNGKAKKGKARGKKPGDNGTGKRTRKTRRS